MAKKISNKILKQFIKEAINEQTSLNERRWTVKDPTRPATEPPRPIAWRKVKADLMAALKEKGIEYGKGWWRKIPNRNDKLRVKYRNYYKAVKYHRKSAQNARADKATPPEEKGLTKAETAWKGIWTAVKQFSGELRALQELPVAEGMNLRQLARTLEKQFSQVQGSTGKQLEVVFKKITGRDPADVHTGDAPPKAGAAAVEKTGHETNWGAVEQATRNNFGQFPLGSKELLAQIAKGTGDFDTDHQAVHKVHDKIHRAADWLTKKTVEADGKNKLEKALIRLHTLLLQRIKWFHNPANKKGVRRGPAQRGPVRRGPERLEPK